MILASFLWGSPTWSLGAALLGILGLLVLAWGYWPVGGTRPWKVAALTLKAAAILGLAICLAEPLFTGVRAKSGANMFAVVADNSRSMTIHDRGAADSRGHVFQALVTPEAKWRRRLSDDFDARQFAFDSQLHAVSDFATLRFDGNASSLHAALDSLSRRFRGLPLAGVLLFTDGNFTATADIQWNELPPVYPVLLGDDDPPADLCVSSISATQTNFESAPVVLQANIEAIDFANETISVELIDEQNKVLQRQELKAPPPEEPLPVRFELAPEKPGLSFYRVRVRSSGDEKSLERREATLANNDRSVIVDRGGGPYRVLYVCGRPNWEFKFLRRALADDDQLELVGLVRIAKREPKFAFRRHAGEATNPLFSGFEHPDEEAAERYDQPVLVRLGTKDEHELRDGFPKAADKLYEYDAIILDDLEAGFFTHDQMTLVKDFVSRRGGGLLMLGGPDSFSAGAYDRTPIGVTLPVYCTSGLDAAQSSVSIAPPDIAPGSYSSNDPPRPDHQYRLLLTREGWLQPWVRVRSTEAEEKERLALMASFQLLSHVGGIKPAATVLAEVANESGQRAPAFVIQRFGRGRSAALLISDLWRWGLKRDSEQPSDLEKSWRQTVRWLVADVPRRVELEMRPHPESPADWVELQMRVHDAEYLPLDNAQFSIEVTAPDGRKLPIDAEPQDGEPGRYTATLVPRQVGAYRVKVVAKATDGTPIGERETGWIAQPAADEFKDLRPNRAVLEEIATKTGGNVVAVQDLESFINDLPNRKAPVTEPWIRPAWHHPMLYLAIIACLCAEWGLRRWKGLP